MVIARKYLVEYNGPRPTNRKYSNSLAYYISTIYIILVLILITTISID